MSTFRLRLDKILSEMPVRHFRPAGRRYEASSSEPSDGEGKPAYFSGKSYDGYASPRYIGIVSDKLSRMTGYNFNIFIIEGRGETVTNVEDLSEVTELPLSELEDAINFIMTGNREFSAFSPWLYIHQLGEAISLKCGNFADGENADGWEFNDFYDTMFALDNRWIYRLKMGSARDAKAYESDIMDLHQELMTEYLWHGGRIRIDSDGLDKNALDVALNSFYDAMKNVLDRLVGQVLINDAGG